MFEPLGGCLVISVSDVVEVVVEVVVGIEIGVLMPDSAEK